MRKKILMLVLMACMLCALIGCGDEELPAGQSNTNGAFPGGLFGKNDGNQTENTHQNIEDNKDENEDDLEAFEKPEETYSKMSDEDKQIVIAATDRINNNIFTCVSFSLTDYVETKDGLKLCGEIFYAKPYDTFVIQKNIDSGIRHVFYYGKHYWVDGEEWYYDDKEAPPTSATDYIPFVEESYATKVLGTEVIDDVECYAIKFKIPEGTSYRKIVYYVTTDYKRLVGIKEKNVISVLDYDTRDFDLNSYATYKESGDIWE